MGPEGGHDRAPGDVVANGCRAVVKRQNALDNRQSQPESAGISVATVIEADEGVKDALSCIHGDAGSVITDVDENPALGHTVIDRHTVLGIPNSIGKHILNGPFEINRLRGDVSPIPSGVLQDNVKPVMGFLKVSHAFG